MMKEQTRHDDITWTRKSQTTEYLNQKCPFAIQLFNHLA